MEKANSTNNSTSPETPPTSLQRQATKVLPPERDKGVACGSPPQTEDLKAVYRVKSSSTSAWKLPRQHQRQNGERTSRNVNPRDALRSPQVNTTFAGADSKPLLRGVPPEVAHGLQQRDNGVQLHGLDVPYPDIVRHLLALGRDEARVGAPRHTADANLWVLLPARGISESALQTRYCHQAELAS